jgi:hypothetical protein
VSEKNNDSNSKFKNLHFLAPKIHKNFDCSSQATKITNKLLRIARKNSNKTIVFTISKNFMAQDKHQKISKKYSKLTI